MNSVPNTWLISNSSIYFADGLIRGSIPINAYNIFDLSKLSEALLLSDKIVTIPGRGTEIETYQNLKNDNRVKVEELNVNDGIMDKIVGLIRSGDEIHKILDKDLVVSIFSDIFGVYDRRIDYVDNWRKKHYKNKRLILDAVSWSPDWATTNWASTFEHMDRWFHSDIHEENIYHEMLKSPRYYGSNPDEILTEIDTTSHYTFQFQNMITDTYLRTILYLKVASQYQLNYSPDSIRVPLVQYIDSVMLDEVKKFGQRLVERYENNDVNSREYINNIAYEINEIKLPILGVVINKMHKSNLTKKDFLNTILDLREEKKIKNIRQILSVLDKAIKAEDSKDIQEWEKMKKKLKLMPGNGPANSILVKINNVLEKLRPIFTVAAAATGLSFDSGAIGATTAALGFAPGIVSYFKQRRFTLLKELNKEVNHFVWYNKKLQGIFDSKLSGEDINLLRSLRASQKKYLESI